jgi:hypothetical protein
VLTTEIAILAASKLLKLGGMRSPARRRYGMARWPAQAEGGLEGNDAGEA